MIYNLYYIKSELNLFNSIYSFVQTDIALPFGYGFTNHVWGNLYNSETNNKIGVIIANNSYINTADRPGGNVDDDIVIFIEKELPIGSINYLYNFYTTGNNTLIPLETDVFPTIRSLSGEYYGKNIQLRFDVKEQTRNITLYIQ